MFTRGLPKRDERCVLCGRDKASVGWLIVGLVAAVCSDCAMLAAELAAEKQGDDRRPYLSSSKIELVPGDAPVGPPFMVELEPDVAHVFVDSEMVNLTLRPLAKLIQAQAVLAASQRLTESQEDDSETPVLPKST